MTLTPGLAPIPGRDAGGAREDAALDLSLSGVPFVEQWAIPASPPACPPFGVYLSDALRVTIGS